MTAAETQYWDTEFSNEELDVQADRGLELLIKKAQRKLMNLLRTAKY